MLPSATLSGISVGALKMRVSLGILGLHQLADIPPASWKKHVYTFIMRLHVTRCVSSSECVGYNMNFGFIDGVGVDKISEVGFRVDRLLLAKLELTLPETD